MAAGPWEAPGAARWDYAALGRFVAAFNFLELAVHALIWEWLEAPPAQARAVTARLHFGDLVGLIERLALSAGLETSLRSAEGEDLEYDLDWNVSALLDQLRDLNAVRNQLVHGAMTVEGLEWIKKSLTTGEFSEIEPPSHALLSIVDVTRSVAQIAHVRILLRARSSNVNPGSEAP